MKIVLIGAGNVATHLGTAFKKKGLEILQVYSRTQESAKVLGKLLGVPYCFTLEDVNTSADIYIYAVKDSFLEATLRKVCIPNAIHAHTAGSVPMAVFENHTPRYGVIYPLQTFSKNKEIKMKEVPFFIEASDKETEEKLREIVSAVSDNCYYLSSEKRLLMHLSAVFACNFTNYMYVLASEITTEAGIDFNVLMPLIKETADKLNYLTPAEAQTGPAARSDEKTIEIHKKILANKNNLYRIYSLLSESIEKSAKSR